MAQGRRREAGRTTSSSPGHGQLQDIPVIHGIPVFGGVTDLNGVPVLAGVPGSVAFLRGS